MKIQRKTSNSNPNKNVRCCICNEIGVLRPRVSNGKILYYFAHPKYKQKEIRHHISLHNRKQMSYCKELDWKHKEKIDTQKK
jgi:hypothetical protein